MLTLSEMPEPSDIFVGSSHLILSYRDHSKVYGMCSDERYDGFSFINGGRFIYSRSDGGVYRLCGSIDLFEGECFIYLIHGFDSLETGGMMTVDGMQSVADGCSVGLYGEII